MLRTPSAFNNLRWISIGSVLLIACVAFVVQGAVLFPAAGPDDAYMTFWVADMLVTRGEILNYNGDAVEQSSTLGFVIATAVTSRLFGMESAIAAKYASALFGLGAIVVGGWAALRLDKSLGIATVALTATCAYFIFWSFSGMEGSMAAMSGTALVFFISKVLDEGATAARLVGISGLAMTYAASRPEGLLILGSAVLALAVTLVLRQKIDTAAPNSRWLLLGRLGTLAAVCLGAIGILVAYRFWTFGLLFPEPAYAKSSGFEPARIFSGLRYVLEGSVDSGARISEFLLLLLVAGFSAVRSGLSAIRADPRSWVLPVCGWFFIANLAFVLMVGGDGMPGGRFLVPAVPVAALLATSELHRWLTSRAFALTIGLWAALQVGGGVAFATSSSMASSHPLWRDTGPPVKVDQRFNWFELRNDSHRRYIPAVFVLEREVGRLARGGRPVTILSGQSGFVMYHLLRANPASIRYVDRFGLVTRDFRSCSVASSVGRTIWGLEVGIEDYLSNRVAYREQCVIPEPDVVYDLFWEDELSVLTNLLTSAGFTLVYVQDDAWVKSGDQGRAYVAVRSAIRER